jgi:hypothetical protein
MDHSRRTFLGVAGTGIAGTLLGTGTASAAGGVASADDLHEVVSITDPVPENVGFDLTGDLYVGVTGGSVRRLPADRTDETGLTVDDTHLVAEYPGGVGGVTVADGVLYATVNGETGGVYALDLRASDAHPESLGTVVAADEEGFVNDIYPLGSRLLVTESFGGRVYELPLTPDGECEPSVWTESGLLDTPSFGANGITAVRGDVFVAVTRVTDTVGRVVRVPVECDGSAGEAETYAEGPELFGADGLTSRGATLYAALNAQNRVARVDADGVETVLDGELLSFPSEVVFDPTAPETAFVCNFSNSAPEHGGVLRGSVPRSDCGGDGRR